MRRGATAMAKNDPKAPPPPPVPTCVWCKKPIEVGDDRELHVSLLGAPGQFHKACFAEHEASR
jgi:hypothetical protein